MKIEIGAYEAKTKLPELLRGVQGGKRYIITHRGKPVAELGPPADSRLERAASAVDEWKRHLAEHPPRVRVNIKALIEEGRD